MSTNLYVSLVGKRVKIRQTSPYYRENIPSNPQDIVGVIVSAPDYMMFNPRTGSIKLNRSLTHLSLEIIEPRIQISVQWSNGCSNSYSMRDLEFVDETLVYIEEDGEYDA